MTPVALAAYQAFQPAEKACWEVLLREHEVGREIPTEMLEVAMNRTLARLWDLLRRGTVQLEGGGGEAEAVVLPVRGTCALETFLPYFSSGEGALELIGKELQIVYRGMVAADREELRLAWEIVVQCELQRLCAVCAQKAECPWGGARWLHAREQGVASDR